MVGVGILLRRVYGFLWGREDGGGVASVFWGQIMVVECLFCLKD